jgi:ribose-phosphate pyrophosphokinase
VPLFADWIRREVLNPVVIGPDSESGQWVGALAQKANVPFLTLNKVRRGDRQVKIEDVDLSKWRKHTPLLVDDIISTGTTLVESIKLLKANGLGVPVCMAVHGLFAAQAYEALIEAGAKRIVTTNTVRHPTNQIDVSDAIAQSVQSFL